MGVIMIKFKHKTILSNVVEYCQMLLNIVRYC